MKIVQLLAVVALCSAAYTPTVHADEIAEAREHFRKGSKAFDLGHYEEAIKEYEAAYNFKEDPALLFNIAQAYRLAGDNQNAVRVYKSYLHHSPNAPNHAEVERRIAELQTVIDQQNRAKEGPPEGTMSPNTATPPPTTAQPVVVAPATPPAESPDAKIGRTKKIAGIAVAAFGVAAIAVGGAFAAMAVKAGDDLTRLNNSGGTFDSSKQSAGKTDQIVEGVCFGIGGAAVAAGAVLYVLGHREAKAARSRASASFLISPTMVGASAKVSF